MLLVFLVVLKKKTFRTERYQVSAKMVKATLWQPSLQRVDRTKCYQSFSFVLRRTTTDTHACNFGSELPFVLASFLACFSSVLAKASCSFLASIWVENIWIQASNSKCDRTGCGSTHLNSHLFFSQLTMRRIQRSMMLTFLI